MITAPMLTYGVKVKLPTTTAKPMPIKQEPLVISINTKKEIFIDRNKVPLEKLKDKLKPMIKRFPKRNVLLQADQSVPYGFVMKVMGKIKAAGIENLGLVTRPLKEKR